MRTITVCMLVVVSTARAYATPLKIMPLGDSITVGYPARGGYRYPFYQALAGHGCDIQFVGSQTTNTCDGLPSPCHEGHGGWRINDIGASITQWMGTYQPDVVLLMIGTNDVAGGYSAGLPDRLGTLLDTIIVADPGVSLFVASIPPAMGDLDLPIRQVNELIPPVIQARQDDGKHVYFVDVHSAVNNTTDMYNNYHPNASGQLKIAIAWENAFAAVYLPEPTTFILLCVGGCCSLRRRQIDKAKRRSRSPDRRGPKGTPQLQ